MTVRAYRISGLCSVITAMNVTGKFMIYTWMLRLPIEYNKMKGQPPKNTQNCGISAVDLVLLLEVSVSDNDRQSLTLK